MRTSTCCKRKRAATRTTAFWGRIGTYNSQVTVITMPDVGVSVAELGYDYTRAANRWWQGNPVSILEVVSIIPVNIRNAQWCSASWIPQGYVSNTTSQCRRVGTARTTARPSAISCSPSTTSTTSCVLASQLSFQVDRPACPEQTAQHLRLWRLRVPFANYLTSDVSDVPLDLTQAVIPRC